MMRVLGDDEKLSCRRAYSTVSVSQATIPVRLGFVGVYWRQERAKFINNNTGGTRVTSNKM